MCVCEREREREREREKHRWKGHNLNRRGFFNILYITCLLPLNLKNVWMPCGCVDERENNGRDIIWIGVFLILYITCLLPLNLKKPCGCAGVWMCGDCGCEGVCGCVYDVCRCGYARRCDPTHWCKLFPVHNHTQTNTLRLTHYDTDMTESVMMMSRVFPLDSFGA